MNELWVPNQPQIEPPPPLWVPGQRLPVCPGHRGYDELRLMPQVGINRPFGPRVYPDHKFASSIDLPAPLAFFTMDASSGSNETDTVSSRTLTNNGTVGSAAGVISNARVAGTNNFLSGTSASVYQITGNWSMAFWFKAGALGGAANAVIAKTGDTNFPPNLLEWNVIQRVTGNNLQFSISYNGSNFTNIISADAANTGTYICVICWYQLSDNTLHIQTQNGTESAPVTLGGATPHTDSSDMWVGKYHQNFDFFGTGSMDLLAFWNVVLTSTQRSNYYNSGSGRQYVSGVWSA